MAKGRPRKNRTEEENKEMVAGEIAALDRDESQYKPKRVQVEKALEKCRSLAKEITDNITACETNLKKLLELQMQIYFSLVNPDALLSDCPISPAFTKEWARQQFYAAGIRWGEDIWEGEISVKPFVDRIVDAEPWVLRYANEEVKKKQGIEAILEDRT